MTTIAGSAFCGDDGNGGPATSAKINYPCVIAFDSRNNLYFSERSGFICKVSASGIISVIVGTGVSGYNGDDIPASDAQVNQPIGVAIDQHDNIYFAEHYGHRVRKVDATSGYISTFAGNGNPGFGGDGGPATAAMLNYPDGIAFDHSGNLYIADGFNARIRKVDPAGIISTYAGNGNAIDSGDGNLATMAALSSGMAGISCDRLGNVYLVSGTVRKIDAATHIISRFAGNGTTGGGGDGGPATAASVFSLGTTLSDPYGNILLADDANNKIRRIDAVTGFITTIAGTGVPGFDGDGGPPLSAKFHKPTGLAFDTCNNLFVTDLANCRIRKIAYNPSCTPFSVASVADQDFVNMYPNPASNFLFIDNIIPPVAMHFFSMTGVLIKNLVLTEDKNAVDMSDIPSGAYLMEWNTEDTRHRRIIVKKQ